MSILTIIPDIQYFDLSTWIQNVQSFEKIHQRNHIEIYFYIFSNNDIEPSKRPIILCRTALEHNANICVFLQTYYYKGEYSTIDCICLEEDNYSSIINKYFKFILTDELSKIPYDLIIKKNRFIICHNKITRIHNLKIYTPEKKFFNYDFSDLINYIFFPTIYTDLNAKNYIENCLLAMTNNKEEKDYYQKILNIYLDRAIVKNIFKYDHENYSKSDYFEDILNQLDVKINREIIFK